MSYKIEFLEEASKDWLNLDYSLRKKLTTVIERLKSNPQQYGKPLGGSLHGLRRIRSGDYRIVYKINELNQTIEVGVVCHRENVYQIALKRHLI